VSAPFRDAERLRTIADYQFGAGAGPALFPDGESPTVHRSESGRPRQVLTEAPAEATGNDGEPNRIVSLGRDGRLTLGLAGGTRLLEALAPPRCRVVVGEESVPFVREGKNAFAKFVTEADRDLRPGDEAAVTHDGDLLGVGRVELPATGMADFDRGMAVKIRNGVQP
jgi:uncharacterized protein with predicted RNA binding PUA domain